MMGIRGRRHKQLLDDLKETRGYWKLKEEALDRTLWGTRCGTLWTRRKTDYRMKDNINKQVKTWVCLIQHCALRAYEGVEV